MARVRRALAVAGLALTLALGSADGRSGTGHADDSPSDPLFPTFRVVAFNLLCAGSSRRRPGARAVADLARASALRAVVMGDFDATATSPAVRLLTVDAGFVDALAVAWPGSPGFTDGQDVRASVRTAHQRIDYVFPVPGRSAAARIVGSRVISTAGRRGRGPVGRGSLMAC